MKKSLVLLFFILPALLSAQSHAFSGRAVDSAGEGVPYVTVIIQDADSIVVEAVLTDPDGYFNLREKLAQDNIVIVQHLSYETAVLSGSQLISNPVVAMAEKENTLEDVVVRGERPLVTIVDNKLSYDAEALVKDRIVNNAFEVIKELPGVSGDDDGLELIGAGKFTIVINGQITSMSLTDLYALLRTIPASQVKRLNVAYNAPAKYNFNGAVIEVELIDNTGYEGTTGEVAANYTNRFYSGGSVRGSVNIERERYSFNILGEVGRRKFINRDSTYSRHFYEGEYVDIFQPNRRTGQPDNYSLRFGSDYKLGDAGNLNFSYYYSGSNSTSRSLADNIFSGENIARDVRSDNRQRSNTHLHNLHLQYDGAVTAGADYTRYNSPDSGLYEDYENGVPQTAYRFRFAQKVDKYNLFLNRNSVINSWKLDYGMNFSTARSDNNSRYFHTLPSALNAATVSEQSEYFANLFFEVSRQINEKLSLKVGLKGEYQYSNIENNGVKENVWSEWAFYPDMSLSYMASPKHILQLNVTSDKRYPPYWAMSTNESRLNAYAYVTGNTQLKPSREYRAQMSYIFNRKYILMAFASYDLDLFRQLPYQREDRLEMEYKFVNMDFQLSYGFALIVPFKIGKYLDSRLVVNGMEIVDRIRDFNGINVRNNKFLVLASLRNTVPLYHGKKQKVDMQLDFHYQGNAVQGMYELGPAYRLNTGLRWSIGEKLTASARWENILRRGMPRPIKVDMGNQYTSMRQTEYSTVTLNLSWRFGKYEEKKFKNVDSSRFGKN